MESSTVRSTGYGSVPTLGYAIRTPCEGEQQPVHVSRASVQGFPAAAAVPSTLCAGGRLASAVGKASRDLWAAHGYRQAIPCAPPATQPAAEQMEQRKKQTVKNKGELGRRDRVGSSAWSFLEAHLSLAAPAPGQGPIASLASRLDRPLDRRAHLGARPAMAAPPPAGALPGQVLLISCRRLVGQQAMVEHPSPSQPTRATNIPPSELSASSRYVGR